MPIIDFRISPEAPPTDYLDAHFAGVYAVSVWTHFAEDLALAWLDEMHRIVAPGGFLVFSAAGSARLAHGMQGASPEQVQKITLVWHRLMRNGFVFFPTYANEQHHGLDTSRWGLTRMTPEWVISKIIPKWALLAFDPGRYGPRQDIYVLQRR
jgi:SAM-dependent methyltransferase